MLFSACCFSAFSNHLLFVIMPSVTFNSNAENFNRMPLLWPGVMTYIIITKRMVKGPELFGEPFFLPFCFFFGFPPLSIFLAICGILELEAAISTAFASIWNSNLSFSMVFATFRCYLQHFGAGSCHFNSICNIFEFEPLIFHGICNYLQHVGARTVHVTW